MSEAQEKALSLLRFVSLCITPIEKSPKDDSIETAGCK